ncbi:MAG TPA: transglutaminase domain-containing protein [Acidimicrobiales bacterium]|nr:transglutaminase domain-containing protein [Acidimicrobiales bacterium]
MSITDVEAAARDSLGAEAGQLGADLDAVAVAADAEPESERPAFRVAAACAVSSLAAAIMVGGIFQGAGGRIYSALFAIVGVAAGLGISRIRRASTAITLMVLVMFAAGLVALLPTGFGNVLHVKALVSTAAHEGSLLRPPVQFLPGWHAVVGWLLGIVGLVSVWAAVVVGRPALGVLLPLPLAAVAGVSVPKSAQVASGIVVVVLFAVALGLLSGAGSGPEEEKRPLGYELRRAAKSLVFLAVISGALVGLSRTHLLFPAPIIDPAHQAQLPKTAPLTAAPDRVLFQVKSKVTGPWRIGSLDVYDGTYWRLPPFAEAQIKAVPRSGVVDPTRPTGETATFIIKGLSGAVLPTLPNTVGIVASGPQLAYDARSGNIRLIEGQVNPGFTYTVAAAPLPKVTDLEKDDAPLPPAFRQFVQVPPAPEAVKNLISQLRGSNKWDTFDALRQWVLQNVTVSGAGQPSAVPPSRIADMIDGSKQGTPFEIVAAQALLARWVGVPSRIGYGFDGGAVVNGVRQVSPRDAASFVEVYFPGFEWLPVIGTPAHAKATSGSNLKQASNAQAAQVFGTNVYLPVPTPPGSAFAAQLGEGIGLVVALILLVLLVYFLLPGIRKSVVRSRRRRAAVEAGPNARIALAYGEWRDYCTDLGYRFPSDTPLGFLLRVTADDEHTELAWLVTRVIWGDLRGSATEEMAVAAEELSRALRRRLGGAHTLTARFLATLSRLSERQPWAPDLVASLSGGDEKGDTPATDERVPVDVGAEGGVIHG